MNETILNHYFNVGKYNHPSMIGYVMDAIRICKPITKAEWELYYFKNIRSQDHVRGLSVRMAKGIPDENNMSRDECYEYIKDVIIRRTFNGYNKEKQALKILKERVSDSIVESSREWDSKYFIDFCFRSKGGKIIGIQLKPETFYLGNYEDKVDIEEKLKQFRERYDAMTFVLIYSKDSANNIHFTNQEVIEHIKAYNTI